MRTVKEQNEAKALIRKYLGSDDVVILDTETTGLGQFDRIMEISIIDMSGEVLFSSLINPGVEISQMISDLTGITNEMLKDAPPLYKIAGRILEALNGKTVLAWNSSFDERMVRRAFSFMSNPRLKRLMCTFEDAMKLYCRSQGYYKLFKKLQEAMVEMSISRTQDHRSLGDCMDTLAVLKEAVKDVPSADLFSVDSLIVDIEEELSDAEEKGFDELYEGLDLSDAVEE